MFLLIGHRVYLKIGKFNFFLKNIDILFVLSILLRDIKGF